jgi:predicted transcriptional regulator
VNQDRGNYNDRYFTQKEKARMHAHDIIYGLRALERATSGEIDKYIRDNIVKMLQEQIECNPWNKVENKENIDHLLESHKQSKRIIQKWLPKLEAKGLVTKDKYYVYSLTNKGKKLNIFPDVYGRMLLGTLINLPWHETKDKNIIEFIKRIGAFMLYACINFVT